MVIVTKYVPLPKPFFAINICGIIFAKRPLTEVDKNHELIHSSQCWELFVLGFYIWYGIEYLIRMIQYGNNAYRNISFEREAYANEHNLNYRTTRKRNAWARYLSKE